MPCAIGFCSSTTSAPQTTASSSARARAARCSAVSPAPTACAVRPVVPILRNANGQNTKSKMTAASATAPKSAASPSWPMTAVLAKPSSGVETLASVIGIAMASTRRWVIAAGDASSSLVGAPACAAATGQARPEPTFSRRRMIQIGITTAAPIRK